MTDPTATQSSEAPDVPGRMGVSEWLASGPDVPWRAVWRGVEPSTTTRFERGLQALEQALHGERYGLGVILALGLGALLAVLVFWGLNSLCNAPVELPMCDERARGAMWSAGSALVVVPALSLTWYWRTRHRREELAISHRVALQVNQRFAQAVELLGSKQTATRLGAVYAFEQLNEDAGTTTTRQSSRHYPRSFGIGRGSWRSRPRPKSVDGCPRT